MVVRARLQFLVCVCVCVEISERGPEAEKWGSGTDRSRISETGKPWTLAPLTPMT